MGNWKLYKKQEIFQFLSYSPYFHIISTWCEAEVKLTVLF